jgi:hypothetical protein
MRFFLKPIVVTLVVPLYPALAAACSEDTSPGVWERNRVIVRWLLGLSVILLTATLILYFIRHRKGLIVVLASVLLVIFHPAWIYGGGGGDCGVSMAKGARNSAILLAVGVAYQCTLWLMRRRAPIERRT